MNNLEEKKEENGKPARRISEETLQMIANVIITTVSSAALVISLAAGMKGKRRG